MFSFNDSFNKLVNRIHLSFKGSRTVDGKFDWKNAILDAAIISGINLFTGLGTLAAIGDLDINALFVLVATVGAEFLGVITAKRGLNISKTNNTSNKN
ncbi:MAG: hypothetical protein LBH62_03615 [Nitrososphaerota archaeon]|jgi:hypothetical protein|uniref:hypothetical protein n=1 Tax=Candidatus Bathycorpusculum sp. TaxID=2994959 RepID=UPI0028255F13|nr:hypothetical protein [Candidatus Termiticorpusculum sp.]MCL2256898.1 hypothetical protein [Candidatus Termiticorpusculum sp.]MCL2293002.1 hypothetical protein [Candidatus Termiticorpusculum sp.]MDR0460513.1 hypothetical protein [Nitrososphaerota archaeon]